jgi:hypothetical protein
MSITISSPHDHTHGGRSYFPFPWYYHLDIFYPNNLHNHVEGPSFLIKQPFLLLCLHGPRTKRSSLSYGNTIEEKFK